MARRRYGESSLAAPAITVCRTGFKCKEFGYGVSRRPRLDSALSSGSVALAVALCAHAAERSAVVMTALGRRGGASAVAVAAWASAKCDSSASTHRRHR